MTVPPPQARIDIIRASRRCFARGILSFLPLAGLPAAVAVFFEAWRLKRRYGTHWNPERRSLRWAERLAALGIIWSCLLAVLAGMLIAL